MALPLRVPEPSGSAILISGEQQHLPMPLVSALTHVTRTPDITASAGESPRTHESRHDRGLVVVGVESADSTQFDDTSSGNTHPDDSIGAFGVAHEADVHKWQQEGISGEVLPPYVAQGAPPVYTEEKEEPLTTTQFLFFFGFLFFPFWLVGIYILFTPLRVQHLPMGIWTSYYPPPPGVTPDTFPSATPLAVSDAWIAEKTPEQHERAIQELRRVEVKWAKLCLCAMVVWTLVMVGFGITAWWYLGE